MKLRLKLIIFCTLSILSLNNIKTEENALVFNNLEQLYGNESLKPENIVFIEKIAKQMELTKLPIIKKMNSNAFVVFGASNAFVAGEYLFVSENFFELLTEKEKTFLIGHELVHYKKEHSRKIEALNTFSFTGAVLVSCFALYKAIELEQQEDKYKRLKQWIASLGLVGAWSSYSLMNFAYRRSCEKEADLKAIKKLDCAQGGIAFANRLKSYGRESTGMNWFSTHPSCNKRIAYMTSFINTNSR